MIISLSWVSDYVDTSGVSPDAIAEQLTRRCAEVEGIRKVLHPAHELAVVQILGAEAAVQSGCPHLVKVLGESQTHTALSDAPSVVPGARALMALRETSVASARGEGPMAGVADGVLCCPRDLGFDVPGSDLIAVPTGIALGPLPPGQISAEDWLIEIDNKSLTNRPDLWGHYGFAREVGAILERDLASLRTAEWHDGHLPELPVHVDAEGDCPRYCAIELGQVRSTPSPLWMQSRLMAVGQRPIHLAVDVSNFVMLELGQPTHGFDAERIGSITVGHQTLRTHFLGLDGQLRDLEPEDLVVRSDGATAALAGIIGGRDTEIRTSTERIVLESACFRAGRIRTTSRRLDLRTEASQRFEKGQPEANTEVAVRRYVQLMADSGAPVRRLSRLTVRVGSSRQPARIRLPLSVLRERSGSCFAADEVSRILRRLGFSVSIAENSVVTWTPSHRSVDDVSLPEDLIEEIVRLRGLNTIAPVAPGIPSRAVPRAPLLAAVRTCHAVLALRDRFNEVQTYAWFDADWLPRLGYTPVGSLEIRNPTTRSLRLLRTELVPNLLAVANENSPRHESLAFYEIGRVFRAAGPAQMGEHTERTHVAGITGRPARKSDPLELFLATKGSLTATLTALSSERISFDPAAPSGCPWVAQGLAAEVLLGGARVGGVGLLPRDLSRGVSERLSLAWFEVCLDEVVAHPPVALSCAPPPRYPGSWLDYSLLWPKKASFDELDFLLNAFDDQRLIRREFRSVYRGAGVPDGFVCLTFRLHLGSSEGTLASEDLEQVNRRLRAFLDARGVAIR